MSERSPTTPRSWRSAALGALGGLMVLLPLGEVMRHQTQEFQLLSAERAQLDPLAQAVVVQRGLLSHGELCQRLLAGRTALEPQRQLRQAVVDNALWDLKNTLAAGLWVAALGEAGQLGLDWRALTQRIQARTVDLKSSQAEHRLLIEQTLQVMDLVTAAAPATGAQLRLALHRATSQAVSGSVNPAANPATPASIHDESNSQRAQALALARLQDQIQAHSQSLDERLIGLLAARAWLGAVAVALLVLAAAALLMRRSGTVPSPVPPTAQDGVRLGQGRRATDADRVPNAASRLMWQLRQGPSRSSAAYPDTLPPQP